MTKKTIIAVIIYLATAFPLFCQQLSDFTLLHNSEQLFNPTHTMYALDYHIFIPDFGYFTTLDIDTDEIREYTATNTSSHPYRSKIPYDDSDTNNPYISGTFFPSTSDYVQTVVQKYKDHYYFNGYHGLWEFEENKDSLILLDIKYQDIRIASFCFIDDFLYLIHRIDSGKRIFERINLIEPELVDTIYMFGTAVNKLFFDGKKIYWYSGGTIECSISIDKEFKNENVEQYDFKTIKTKVDSMYPEASYTYDPENYDIYMYASLKNALTFNNNQIRVAFIDKWPTFYDSLKKPRYSETPLFICENGIWDTINLQTGLDLLNDKVESYIIYWFINHTIVDITGIFKWNDEEIAINVRTPLFFTTDSPDAEDLRTLLIYNIFTKQWRKFIIPPEYLSYRSPIIGLLNWQDTIYFIPLKTEITNKIELIKYTGTTSITDTDEGIFQEIGFRKVYPNPVTYNSITADIMCYVPDISKVELGLYDLMGQKILDLTDQFDYSAATHTINITFAPPKDLPKGVYYLNVRKGTETRTKAIAIGQ